MRLQYIATNYKDETVESQQRLENKAVTLSLLVLGFVPGPVSPECLLPQGYWKLYI